jgi:uncharacterized protein (TIRG00374 family)
MKIKKHVSLAIGCLISGFAIWYTTRGVEWGEFGRVMKDYRYIWLVPALATFYFSMYLRGVRWGLLFRPNYHLNGRQLFPPIMICFAFNSILPARVGEFVRCFYVGRREKTGVPTAMATVVAERIFDGLCLLLMLAVAARFLDPLDENFALPINLPGRSLTLDKHLIDGGIRKLVLVSLILAAGVILFMIPLVQRITIRLTGLLPLLPYRFKDRIVEIIGQVARGFNALGKPSVLLQIVLHTLLIWLLVALSNQFIAMGFDIRMNTWQAMAMVTLIGFAILIPAAPGYWGLYEAGGVFSLIVLGVVSTTEQSIAFAVTLMTHLVQYIPIVVIGMYFAWRSHVRLVKGPEC